MIDRSTLPKNCFLFDLIEDDEITYILNRAAVSNYDRGDFLFKEGDHSEHFSVILKGQIEIIKSFGSEVERSLKVLPPGEYFGEMSLVYKNHRRTATARALEAAQLLEIPISEFEPLVQRNPRLSYQLMQTLIERVIENETATIRDLEEKNRLLGESLAELKAAQAQLIAQERLETELATAYQIQKSMLPTEIPSLPGWNLTAHWQPARAVSGDFYDFIKLPDKRVALVVGDVTDKGVPAALLMTVTRSTLRTAAALAKSPGELLARANDILCPQMPFSMFATCQVAYLDPTTGGFELANAGHPLPLLYREGQIHEIHASGLSLGLFPGMRYDVVQERISPGECILFYSDGLTEAHNQKKEMLGDKEVMEWVREGVLQPQPLITHLLQRLADFAGAATTQEDDITLVHLYRAGVRDS